LAAKMVSLIDPAGGRRILIGAALALCLASCAGGRQQTRTTPAPVVEPGERAANTTPEGGDIEIGVVADDSNFVPEGARDASTVDRSAAARARETNPAVLALLDDAGRYANDGELEQAAAALERALRIDPRNAGIWHDLGEIQFHQGDYAQAEAKAMRSNALAASNTDLQRRNWQLIAKARRARGDTAGAAQAAERAGALGS